MGSSSSKAKKRGGGTAADANGDAADLVEDTKPKNVPKKAPESPPDELLPYNFPSGTAYWKCEPDAEATIQFAPRGRSSKEMMPPTTLYEVMKLAVKRQPDGLAMAQEPPELVALKGPGPPFPPPLPKSQWRKWTYKEYMEDSRKAAKAFIKLGMVPHDAVSVFGFNAPEWFLSQWGAQFAGGKVAGIYPSDSAAQVQYKTNHSNSSIIVMEGANELEKVASIVDDLPYLKAVVCWAHDNKEEPLRRTDGEKVPVYTWKQLMDMGDKEGSDDELQQRIDNQKPGHGCALIYTSGTTGAPKAVMISHDNLVSEVLTVMYEGIPDIGATETTERILTYLPLSHVAGMLVDVATPVFGTAYRHGVCEVYFARNYDLKAGSLAERLRSVRPTAFLGVPRVWEKIAEKLQAIGAKNGKTKKKLAAWAKAKGLGYQKNLCLGGSGKKPPMYSLADGIILSAIKKALGLDKCKFGFTGAAPIKKETQVYFASLGININEVYGMSECTGAVTWSNDRFHEWGSVGFALPGQELRVFQIDPSTGAKKECKRANDLNNLSEEEQGELCYRGRNIMMGYLANPRLGEDHVNEIKKKNADTIDHEGWLHSGDKGALSVRGMVKVTGRFKELIIGAGGENIAPVPIEDEIKRLCPAISNVMVIGDRRKFNIALVTLIAKGATGELPGTDDLESVATKYCSPRVLTISAAMRDARLINYILKAILDTNANEKVVPSNAAKVQKFTILPRDFSIETQELTATLKLKRSVAEEHNKEIIERMYESKEQYVPYYSDVTVEGKIGELPTGPDPSTEDRDSSDVNDQDPDQGPKRIISDVDAKRLSAMEDAVPSEAESTPEF